MYIDQSAAELRLNVVGGPLDPSQFTFLASDRIVGAALHVRAGIIGASHVFEVRHARLPALHEVFACCDVRAPAEPARQLFSGDLCDLAGAFECEPADGIDYCFSSEVGDLSAGAADLARLESKVQAARRRPGEIGLAHTFPSAPLLGTSLPSTLPGTLPGTLPRTGGSINVPKTVVWVGLDPDERRVRVETAHCYPNEQAIVFSATRIEISCPRTASGRGPHR